jgi:hypothetical protein
LLFWSETKKYITNILRPPEEQATGNRRQVTGTEWRAYVSSEALSKQEGSGKNNFIILSCNIADHH